MSNSNFQFKARGVHVYIENPPSSMIFNYAKSTLALFPFLTPFVVNRCAYSVPEDSQLPFKKAYKFLVSGHWFATGARRCQCAKGAHRPLVKTKTCTRSTGEGEDAKKSRTTYSGIPGNLKESQAYPDALGAAIISSWENAGPLPGPGSHYRSGQKGVQTSGDQDVKVIKASRRRASKDADPWGDDDDWPAVAESEGSQSKGSRAGRSSKKRRGPASEDPWGNVEDPGWDDV